MRRININESIKKAVRWSIMSVLNEDRIEHQNGMVEVDNFDAVKNIMEFKDPNDTLYFVQIVKRDKDNPGQKSEFNAAMYLKEYYIKSVKEFEGLEYEIKSICAKENARAYVWLNPRSQAMVDQYTKVNMSRWKRNPKEGRRFGWKAKALAAGKGLDVPERPLCFIDVDSDDRKEITMVMDIIKKAGIKPLYAYRSLNNGMHIILPDKEAAKKLDFSPINGNLQGLGRVAKMNAKVGVEIDKPTLLYACLKPQGYDKQQARFAKLANRKNP